MTRSRPASAAIHRGRRPSSAASDRRHASMNAKERRNKGTISLKKYWIDKKLQDTINLKNSRIQKRKTINEKTGNNVLWKEGWSDTSDDDEGIEGMNEINTFEQQNQLQEHLEKKSEKEMYQFFKDVRKEDSNASCGFNSTNKKLGVNKKLYYEMKYKDIFGENFLNDEEKGEVKYGGDGISFVTTPRFDYMENDDRRKNPGPGQYVTLKKLGSETNNWYFSKTIPNEMALNNWNRRRGNRDRMSNVHIHTITN